MPDDNNWKYDPEHNHWGPCDINDDGYCLRAGSADDDDENEDEDND